ncbi:titin [Ochlerotatus camptorhynchus]|uniref:titin n=1 Tax=Ochlerotatus camptorhynchus TaxID=644619 RepID=UPI0031DC5FC9
MVVSKDGKRRRKVGSAAAVGANNSSSATNNSNSATGGSSTGNGSRGGGTGAGSVAAVAISVAAKRETPDIDLSPPEVPKRPKVQAQRKFAQGQGAASTSAYLNFSTNPTNATKDAQNRTQSGSDAGPIPELLPNIRPNTEDFLTFLCFRGTPVLPPSLDFFNTAAQQQQQQASASGSRPTASTSTTVTKTGETSTQQLDEPPAKKEEPEKVKKSSTVVASPTTAKENDKKEDKSGTAQEKPAFMPFAVRKRAEQHPENRRVQTVQALRKKYHEQRMAKLRVTAYNKQTRAGNMKNRLDLDEEGEKLEETAENKKDQIETAKKEKLNPAKKKAGKRKSQKKSAKEADVEKIQELIDVKVVLNKDDVEMKNREVSDDKNIEEESPKKEAKEDAPKGRAKGGKKKSLDAEETGKRTTRLSALRSPPARSASPAKLPTNSPTIIVSKPKEPEPPVEQEFSSDDDEPLLKRAAARKKANAKTVNAKKGRKSEPLPEKSPEELPEKKARRSESVSRKSDVSSKKSELPVVEAPPVQKRIPRGRKKKESPPPYSVPVSVDRKNEKKTPTPIPKVEPVVIKEQVVEKPKPSPEKEPVQSPLPESASKTTPKKGTTRKKKVEPATTPEIPAVEEKKSKKTPEPVAEVSSRPSRKTKEAATLYMELIGRKLNHDDKSDDDASSLDSLELPNVRKLEQMENELKANAGKKEPKPSLAKKGRKKKELEEAKPKVEVPKEAIEKVNDSNQQQEESKPVEKSFSDSDEEPLATKFQRKKSQIRQKQKEKAKARKSPVKKTPAKSSPVKEPPIEPTIEEVKPEELAPENKPSNASVPSPTVERLPSPAPIAATVVKTPTKLSTPPKTSSPKVATPQMLSLPHQLTSPEVVRSPVTDDLNSTRVNKSHDNTFQSTAAETSTSPTKQPTAQPQQPFIRAIKPLSRPLPEIFSEKPTTPAQPEVPFNRNVKNDLNMDESDFLKGFEPTSPTSPVAPKTNSLLGNLLPSKEESEKIFGIASVSLAQSSGPLDTKCTLGKCGSVHKPPLGPPVLTESLLGGHLSPRDRRKTKVNMTHEQIQKWIDETSWSPVPDDLDGVMHSLDGESKSLETSKRPVPTPPVAAWEKLVESKPEPSPVADMPALATAQPKKEEEAKPPTPQPSGSASRGPTLKAKPVTVKPEKEVEKEPVLDAPKVLEKKPPKEEVKEEEKIKSPVPAKVRTPSPVKKDTKKETKKVKTEPTATATVTSTTPTATATTATTTPAALGATAPASADRKPIYKQGRTPVYKQEALKPTAKAPNSTTSNKFGAFSPDNEASVYSFDNEDNFTPLATPFRRHGRRESCNSSVRDEVQAPAVQQSKKQTTQDEKAASSSTFQKPVNLGTPTKSAVQPAVSLTLSPEEGAKSAAIAVPLDSKAEASKKTPEEKKPATDESDDDGHTFYIPLQGPNAAGSGKTDQLIQGVAVKLGTEGPEGPNQRVIMHAKLVTKAQMGSNTTPIPESMNVQELVKSLMAAGPGMSKDGISKMVPVGTVQPRFKSSDSTVVDKTPAPSVSAAVVAPSTPAPEDTRGGLSRINSNSSLNSSQRSKNAKAKAKIDTQVQPDNNTAFPRRDDPAQMVEAPVFKPNDKEFHDPIEYIERIAPVAARFGICRIIPPASFKPECRIADDMRFMAYNQYVHKMLHRWGPSAKEYAAIKKYLATQSINLQSPPLIGGMEVDLPRLYHTVQELGGLKEVIEKKKWARVSEDMCFPKAAHDRVSKLDDIYCKYLLPYDTLSPAERQKLFDEVEADWAKREAKARRNADKCVSSDIRNSGDSDEDEEDSNEEEEDDERSMECIMKGRNMPLNQFFRIARNTMALWFKNSEPTVADIESEYWRHVAVRDSHVCVHSGSIDSSAYGFGFPAPKIKGSSCAKHPWNLKVLTNNSSSILRSLGPVMGITIPTLHVGMLFSACCWYRDPHGLPWIEYLHTGASKIWYGVPDDQNSNFRAALTQLVPTHCQNKTIWLPCDTAMVPPHMLTDRNVSLCRTEQQPGQFVVVFPRAYTSSLCSGYAVSESVYFASSSWLDTAKEDFRDIQESCEPTMFSVEQLVFAIANDQRSNHDTLVQIIPTINDIYDKEKQQRQTIKDHGVNKTEKIESKKKTASLEEFECDICRANLYLSLVRVKITGDDDETLDEDERIYCLKHAIKFLSDSRLPAKFCKLAYTYSLDDIEELLRKLQDKIANKKPQKAGVGGGSSTGGGAGGGGRGKSSLHLASTSSQSSSSYQAPSHSKFAGMATMLK